VILYASKEMISNIKWTSTDNVTFSTDQGLYLIMKTSDYIFLKADNELGEIYIIRLNDILSIKVLHKANQMK
jgi:hypothetical protein